MKFGFTFLFCQNQNYVFVDSMQYAVKKTIFHKFQSLNYNKRQKIFIFFNIFLDFIYKKTESI